MVHTALHSAPGYTTCQPEYSLPYSNEIKGSTLASAWTNTSGKIPPFIKCSGGRWVALMRFVSALNSP